MDALRSRGYPPLIHVRAPLITIVDDDASMRASLDNLLRSVGFRAQAFPSAESFLQASPGGVDSACLILDVRMPGMSGIELQERLAASRSRVPIIFVTSHIDDDVRARVLDAGAVAFLYKPFREEELLDAIDGVLEKQPQGGGS
jgi:FixJ family two-component response regulator